VRTEEERGIGWLHLLNALLILIDDLLILINVTIVHMVEFRFKDSRKKEMD